MVMTNIDFPDGLSQQVILDIIPRIGETVRYKGEEFKVSDVIHTISDFSSSYDITVKLENSSPKGI